MIKISENTAGTGSKTIKEWRVMFQSPLGLCESREAAIAVCAENNMNPDFCILPVAVAVTEDSYEVVMR